VHYKNDRVACGREEDKNVEEQNRVDQLTAERTGVVKHEKIVRSAEVHRNLLVSFSERLDIGIRHSTCVAFFQSLFETLAEMFVLVGEDSREHKVHGVRKDPSRLQITVEEEIQNAGHQHMGNVDVCRYGS